MAASQPYAQMAKALPARLQRFIARYPAPSILPAGATPETFKTGYQEASANPFSRQKHPVTGVWHEPVYSLRRQAELVKLARDHGVEELLPPTVKGSEYQLAHRVEHGLRVKGTGVGQKVKGHQHERMVMPRYVVAMMGITTVFGWADTLLQNGEEEKRHVEHAGLDEAMEEGKFAVQGICHTAF
ncbi:hypothetical protein ACHAQH_003524 [Verticillium albo-atrum]